MPDNKDYVPCRTCKGGKQVMKIGGMWGDCSECRGLGKVLNVATVATVATVADVAAPKELEPPSKKAKSLNKKPKG